MAGELVDAAALTRAFDEADDLDPKAVSAHAYLEAVLGDAGDGDPEDFICSRIGTTRKCYRSVEAIQASIAENRTDGCSESGD